MIKNLMKNSLMSKQVRYQLAHSDKHLISVDGSDSESSSSKSQTDENDEENNITADVVKKQQNGKFTQLNEFL